MMTRIQTQLKRLAGYTVLASALLLVTSAAQAATIPYTENFDDDTVGTAAPSESAPESGTFAEDVDASWSVVNQSGMDNAYRVDTTFDDHGGRTISSTLDFVSTFNSDQTFIMSTDFNVNSFATTDGYNRSTTIGFGALGSSANFSSGAYFLTDFFWDAPSSGDTGKVRIVEFDSSQNDAVLATSSSAISIDSNDNYRLTLKSIVDGGQLELTMTAENLT